MTMVYQNIYPLDPSLAGLMVDDVLTPLSKYGIAVGDGTVISGVPRLTFTRVADAQKIEAGVIQPQIDPATFFNHIRIGGQCYLESSNLPAFHSQPIKLTSVQINDDQPGHISIGQRVVLQGAAILAYQLVEIADDVLFGPMVTIMDSSGHALLGRGKPGEIDRIRSAPVRIEADAWIGTGATILKGVRIGVGALVGAMSVVYEDVPDYAVVIGNPARVVKQLSPGNYANSEWRALADPQLQAMFSNKDQL